MEVENVLSVYLHKTEIERCHPGGFYRKKKKAKSQRQLS